MELPTLDEVLSPAKGDKPKPDTMGLPGLDEIIGTTAKPAPKIKKSASTDEIGAYLAPTAAGASVGAAKELLRTLRNRPETPFGPPGLASARDVASQAQTGVTTALNNYRAQQLPYYTATDIAYANLGATTAAAEEAAQRLAAAQAAARLFGTPVERTPVVNWATGRNTSQGMTPLLTSLQASQQPSMEAAYALNRTMTPVPGMSAGESLILPDRLAGEQRTVVNALQAAQTANEEAQTARAAAQAQWLNLTGNAPNEFARAQTNYTAATSAAAQTAEELARLQAQRPGPLAQVGRGIAKTLGPLLPIAGGALAGHDLVKAVAETQKQMNEKNPNYTEAAMDALSGTGGALMLTGNPYAVGTGAVMSAIPAGRSLVNQYSKAITPMLERDPRNARFLIP